MMNGRTKSAVTLLALAVMTIGTTVLAQARVSAASCFIETDADGDYVWRDGIANLSSGLGWRPRVVRCPISDSVERPRTTITSARISVVDGNNQFGAIHNFQGRVCLSPASFSTTELAPICSPMVELNAGTTTGTRELILPASMIDVLRDGTRWWFPATLIVQVPANNGWPSVLRGYEFFY